MNSHNMGTPQHQYDSRDLAVLEESQGYTYHGMK